jgi:FixJ family two-component response regulator
MNERSHEATRVEISVVDDDESILDSTRQLLRSAGYKVSTFASAEAFFESASVERSECVLLDLKMPGMDGLEVQRRLIGSGTRVPIIFISAHDDAGTKKRAIQAGAVDFLHKPFEAGGLLATIKTALNCAVAGSEAHVLHFGREDLHRVMVLRSAGYLVEECLTAGTLVGLIESGARADLICVSEGVELPPFEALVCARTNCVAPIVFFRTTSQTYSDFKFDLEIEPLTTPAKWLSDIGRLLGAARGFERKIERSNQPLV